MTKRKVFYSFHYKLDSWRASEVRNMGVLEGNEPASDNDWEKVTKSGDKAIKEWIDKQIFGRSCAVVLIGKSTSGRKWIKYEIKKAWNDKKGLVGIYIHGLKDKHGNQTTKGKNPFSEFTINNGTKKLSSVVKAYYTPYSSSKSVYNYIKDNLSDWIEEAIKIRKDI